LKTWTQKIWVQLALRCNIRKIKKIRKTLVSCANGPDIGLQTVQRTKTSTPSARGAAKWVTVSLNAEPVCPKARKTAGSTAREQRGIMTNAVSPLIKKKGVM